jgi:hypothetical protein
MNWKAPRCAIRFVRPILPTAITSYSPLLSLACIDLSRESLTATNSLAGNGPGVVVLRFGVGGRLEHLLEDLKLLGGCALM